jgi:hypothetical protein
MRNSTLTAAILLVLAKHVVATPIFLKSQYNLTLPEKRKKIGNILRKKSRNIFPIKQPRTQNFFRTSAKRRQEKL